jgi:hypothetical protein
MKKLKSILLDLGAITLGCLLMMAGPLLQAIGVIGG